MSRKVEYLQDLAPLFGKFKVLRVHLLEEQRPNEQGVKSYTDEAI